MKLLVWAAMLIIAILIPLIMIGVGKLFMNTPPGKINSTFGYRSKMSMKNEDTWHFAHIHCGKTWSKIGKMMLIPSVVPGLCTIKAEPTTIAIAGTAVCFAQCVILMLASIPTERALKEAFDEEGNRRDLQAVSEAD